MSVARKSADAKLRLTSSPNSGAIFEPEIMAQRRPPNRFFTNSPTLASNPDSISTSQRRSLACTSTEITDQVFKDSSVELLTDRFRLDYWQTRSTSCSLNADQQRAR